MSIVFNQHKGQEGGIQGVSGLRKFAEVVKIGRKYTVATRGVLSLCCQYKLRRKLYPNPCHRYFKPCERSAARVAGQAKRPCRNIHFCDQRERACAFSISAPERSVFRCFAVFSASRSRFATTLASIDCHELSAPFPPAPRARDVVSTALAAWKHVFLHSTKSPNDLPKKYVGEPVKYGEIRRK